jgi:hypothetical protein
MGCGGGSDAGAAARAQQQQQQALIDTGTQQVNQIFSRFNPDFYQQKAQAYTNYAMPQLQQQYGKQQRGLDYQLFGQGLQNSSAARSMNNDLNNQMTQATQNIANQGQQQAQQLQQTLVGEQANVLSQLQQSANPSIAAQSAIGYAANAQAPSAFAPIGQMFNDLGSVYSANKANQLTNQYGSSYGFSPYQQMLSQGVGGANFGIVQ